MRVLVADDHAILRAGLRMLIEAQPDMEVVAEAADTYQLPELTRETWPDVLLLDISMPGPGTAETIGQALRQRPVTRVLVLTMHDDDAYVNSVMMAGAAGYVVKRAADSELLSAIRAVHAGRTFVDLTRSGSLPTLQTGRSGALGGARAKDTPQRLSKREQQVLRLLAQGHTNREMAERIHVSIKTVETYRSRLSQKLGLHSRSELFRFAALSGLLAPDKVPSKDRTG
ncbi:MAG: response regulator transcription factor [Gemmatimonadetes bacterium]|nr:response regulator transcription factor [Gemmatimonadota bacterium]